MLYTGASAMEFQIIFSSEREINFLTPVISHSLTCFLCLSLPHRISYSSRIPPSSSLTDDGVKFPVLQPVFDPRPLQMMPHNMLMLTHMFGNTCWHIFACGSGPPSSGFHFRPLRFTPDVLWVGMLSIWSTGCHQTRVHFWTCHVPQMDLAGNERCLNPILLAVGALMERWNAIRGFQFWEKQEWKV